jgi:hypothetical protein
MNQQCKCGQRMRLELRTIQFAGKMQILHVPMRACDACSSYRLLPSVKSVVADYINKLGPDHRKRKFSFTEINELSQIVHEVFSQNESNVCDELEHAVKVAIHERINILLDLFRYAEAVQDSIWVENLRQRLSQLSSLSLGLDQEILYSHEI